MKIPCKECEKRETRCHVTCDEYIAWQKEHEQIKADAKKARAAYKDYTDYYMKNVERYKKTLRD